MAQALGATVVVNPDADSGPIESLTLALSRTPRSATCVLVHPVDIPVVRPRTVICLVEGFFRAGRPRVVVPGHSGRRGHPVLLRKDVALRVFARVPGETLRDLLATEAAGTVEVTTDDAGVLMNMNTPEDYARVLNGLGASGGTFNSP